MRTLKPAFTLIELLIVLVIIGVVYSLAGSLMTRPQNAADTALWSLERLDEAIRSAAPGYVKLVCRGDRCDRCEVRDGNGALIAENMTLFNKIPVVHRFDRNGYLETRRFAPEICFEMERFENGAVSDLLVEHDSRFYRFYPLLRPAERFSDFEAARKSADALAWLPTDQGRYFHERD